MHQNVVGMLQSSQQNSLAEYRDYNDLIFILPYGFEVVYKYVAVAAEDK